MKILGESNAGEPGKTGEGSLEWRGTRVRGASSREIDVKVLAKDAARFSNELSTILVQIQTKMGELALDEISVKVGLTMGGEFALLGFGGNATAEGVLTFTFKRER